MKEEVTKTDAGILAEPSDTVCVAGLFDKNSSRASHEPQPEPPPGFMLHEELGRGGMGLVYRARDLAFDRDVALKFLQKKYDIASQNTLRFLEEARITGQLQHPGIPSVHQQGKLPDGRPYLVMKLIKGYTLSDMLWGKSPSHLHTSSHVIPENYLAIFEAICQAVGYAHAHHVIHRDLKPHNIMVGAFGEVQVMDWGLAKVLKPGETAPDNPFDPQETKAFESQSSIQTSGSELTTAGSVLGTPSYMPPEQAIGANSQLDTRTDVFGLGAILCTMLTGKPPFQGDTLEATRMQAALGLLEDTYNRLEASGADPDIIRLAKRCLSPQRDHRLEHGGAVAREVAQIRSAADERARQAELERTRAQVHAQEQVNRRRVMLLSGAVIIGVLLVGIVGTTWGWFHAASKEKQATHAARLEHDAKVSEEEQRKQAQAKEYESQAVLDFVENNVFAAARPIGYEMGLGRNVLLRAALLESIKTITSNMKEQPLIEARIRRTLGKSFWILGDYLLASEQFERAYQLYVKHLGQDDPQSLLTLKALTALKQQNAEKK